MSTDNVTPIRSGGPPPDSPKGSAAKVRKSARKQGLLLEASDEFDGFSTHDVLAGLRGVCGALVELEYGADMDIDSVERLAIAAKVLSSMLHNRAG